MFSLNFRKSRTHLWTLLLAICMLFWSGLAFAQLPSTVDEPSISITYNRVQDTAGWGGLLAVPYGNDVLKGHTAAVAQRGGNLIRGKYHAEVGTAFRGFDLNAYTNGLVKKYDGAELGRVSGIGIAVEAPEKDVGAFHFTGGIGIEGANGGQIGSPNAGDTLEALGYDPEVLEAIGAYGINPAPTGLSIAQGNALRALIYAEFAHPSGFVVNVKGKPALFGETDFPVHQLIVSGNTSIEVGDTLSVDIGIDLGFQTWQDADGNDTIQQEIALFTGIKKRFKNFSDLL